MHRTTPEDSERATRRDRNKFAKFLRLLESDDLPEEVKKTWQDCKGRDKQTKLINTAVKSKGTGKYEIDVNATVVKDPCCAFLV
eukprot:6335133-Pyramimonas_sp.AAC.1